MRYDDEKISWIIDEKRKAFKIRCTVILALMISALAVSLINLSDYLTVLFSMLEFPLMLLLAATIKKYNATVLLSKEIRGRNIKEYEYGVHSGAGDGIYRRRNFPSTYANRKIPRPLRINGTVYLELEDGNIKSISGLYKSHMDIYEDGDILVKYAGTRFPVIVSRDAKKQPCPICGEINDESREKCRVCGLGIVRIQKSRQSTFVG